MQQAWPFPFLIAHRGGGKQAPENTLAGMIEAIKQGYRAVEYDVKLSADNLCFLLHDDTVDRTTNGNGLAATQSWAALSQLDAGSWLTEAFANEPLPSFATIASYCHHSGLASNVEIKPCPGREEETGKAVALAAQQLWSNQTTKPLLSSFAYESLVAAKAAVPALPCAWLIEAPWPEDWEVKLKAIDAVSLNTDEALLTEARVKAVKDAGYKLLAYTVNDVERAKTLQAWGVDGIFTDELTLMQKAFS